jgi:hypothetical protein
MNVLYVGLARTIWLFDLNLLNPTGLSLQVVIDEIGKKYRFAKAPKNLLDVDEQKGLSFKAGTFLSSKGVPMLINFTIHTDGVVADTMSSTDVSTEFLVELTSWINQDYRLVLPRDVKKAYVSQMDVECETPLTNLNPRLIEFLKSIESRVKPSDGKFRPFDVAGLSFWTEDATKLGAPAVFKFERKFQAPFSANHYFSQAPIETREHLDLLNEFEHLLKS